MSTIDQFKNAIRGDLARPNQFRVNGTFPISSVTSISNAAGSLIGGAVGQAVSQIGGAIGNLNGGNAGNSLQFLCRSASLPGSNIGMITLPYRGKELKLSGDRKFAPWTIVLHNDLSFNLRSEFEKWINNMSSNKSNVGINNLNYMADWTVQQLDRADGVIATYNLRGCWPIDVSEIQLSMDASDSTEEFAVTMEYQYWERVGITT